MRFRQFIPVITLITAVFTLISCSQPSSDIQTLEALYNPVGNSVMGNPQGDVTLVEFTDYHCGYCKKSVPILRKLTASDPKLRVVIKEIAVLKPESTQAAAAALAAERQGKYLEFHAALMKAKQTLTNDEIMKVAKKVGLDTQRLTVDMATPEITNQVAANNTLAKQLDVQGTPTFFIAKTLSAQPTTTALKQQKLAGVQTFDELQAAIAKVRTPE